LAFLSASPSTPSQGVITAAQFNYVYLGTCRMSELQITTAACTSAQSLVAAGGSVTRADYESLRSSIFNGRLFLGLPDANLRVLQVNQSILLSDIVNLERGLQ